MTMKDENTNSTTTPIAPEALMLLSSHCAHCPGVLDSLSKLIKSGELGSLHVINLEQHPEAMQQYKVRSVPWVRIGKHELTGAQTIEALQQRINWAKEEQNTETNEVNNQVADFDFLLSEGQVAKVIATINKDHAAIQDIMTLLGDSGTVLSTRIGIGVIFEEFTGTDLLKSLVDDLGALTTHQDKRIRADALHYLGMTADSRAIEFLKKADTQKDNDDEIKEIIEDSLSALKQNN
ncbi:thioredoxin family protein [uncultured Cocleimonas sp.]|uniref:thioredoxin family protein n=1 Tax=uncultured Cocleimonas sp. TaxID=1051587 RepID=UPI00261E6955|nr:thioredoxin family protein [uncultured Cocleimonas sp.]